LTFFLKFLLIAKYNGFPYDILMLIYYGLWSYSPSSSFSCLLVLLQSPSSPFLHLCLYFSNLDFTYGRKMLYFCFWVWLISLKTKMISNTILFLTSDIISLLWLNNNHCVYIYIYIYIYIYTYMCI
jgi:hypothetical protein